MVEIPIETDGGAYLTFSCNVGENSVTFRFLWNERDGHWFCDFESPDGKNNGIRIVENSRLLRTGNRVLSAGDFVVLKSELSSEDPLGFENLGTVYKFYFLDRADLATFEGLL